MGSKENLSQRDGVPNIQGKVLWKGGGVPEYSGVWGEELLEGYRRWEGGTKWYTNAVKLMVNGWEELVLWAFLFVCFTIYFILCVWMFYLHVCLCTTYVCST